VRSAGVISPPSQGGVVRSAGMISPPSQGGVVRSAGVVSQSHHPTTAVNAQSSRAVASPMRINNLNRFKVRRRELRASLTPPEARLWNHLKNSQLHGRKFRRQHSVGPYVLDFYCPAEKLAIEVDGAGHDSQSAQCHDHERDEFLGRFRIRVLRFQNDDVMNNLEGVLFEITRSLSTTP